MASSTLLQDDRSSTQTSTIADRHIETRRIRVGGAPTFARAARKAISFARERYDYPVTVMPTTITDKGDGTHVVEVRVLHRRIDRDRIRTAPAGVTPA